MNKKDNKGRVLKNGESQRGDGRYRFDYVDPKKKRCTVYSWTLNPTDRVPAGKKPGKSLRELEDEIDELLRKGLCPSDKTTVKDIVLDYCDTAVRGKAKSTINTYNIAINHLEKQPFWCLLILKIDKKQAKNWIKNMVNSGIGYHSVVNAKRILYSAFQEAVDDDIVVKNPFDFSMAKLFPDDKNYDKNKPQRKPLSEEHLNRLLEFCAERKNFLKWFYVIFILVKTGLRISEFLGLTFDDIDFENNTISVYHQVNCNYSIKNGRFQYNDNNPLSVNPPKTESGNRILAMREEVKFAFLWLMNNRPYVEEVKVDKRSGFVLINRNGKPYTADTIDAQFRRIIEKHNSLYPDNPLPKFTPHCLRHTFCTDMALKGMFPKNLQYAMGHKRPDITMGVYAHTNQDSSYQQMIELG